MPFPVEMSQGPVLRFETDFVEGADRIHATSRRVPTISNYVFARVAPEIQSILERAFVLFTPVGVYPQWDHEAYNGQLRDSTTVTVDRGEIMGGSFSESQQQMIIQVHQPSQNVKGAYYDVFVINGYTDARTGIYHVANHYEQQAEESAFPEINAILDFAIREIAQDTVEYLTYGSKSG